MVHVVMVGVATSGPEKGHVVVELSERMTDGLAQSQGYKASDYLREIEAEIQHQRQLALTLGGVRPLQPGHPRGYHHHA